MTTSDPVGWVKIKMSSLMFNNGVNDWFTISYENKSSGKIHIISKFAPKGGDRYELMQTKMEEQQKKAEEEAAQAKAYAEQLQQQLAASQAQLE